MQKTISGTYRDLNGQDIIANTSTISKVFNLIFRSYFNPVDYNGIFLREIEESYKTNELGFFITCCFFGTLFWNFLTIRRTSLLVQKKRFVFQRYQRNKFLEDSLRLKSREEIVNEKVNSTVL